MRESQLTQGPSLVSLMPHGERHYSVTDVAKLWGPRKKPLARTGHTGE